ncbi:MAG: CheR family methyltransferase, partial [Chitinispirillaceae bacterium]
MKCSDYEKKIKLSQAEIALWCAFMYKECGIELDETKAYLIQSRLTPFFSLYNVGTFLELYRLTQTDKSLVSEIVSALSTHETSFFRDRKFFEVLKNQILPQLLDSQDKLKLWSAACSTGQEAYSLAMICSDLLCLHPGKEIQILGTDICKKSIKTAQKGVYSDFELKRGLNTWQIRRFFISVEEGN